MRGVALCVLASIGINAVVTAGPSNVRMAAANQPVMGAIAAVSPGRNAS